MSYPSLYKNRVDPTAVVLIIKGANTISDVGHQVCVKLLPSLNAVDFKNLHALFLVYNTILKSVWARNTDCTSLELFLGNSKTINGYLVKKTFTAGYLKRTFWSFGPICS